MRATYTRKPPDIDGEAYKKLREQTIKEAQKIVATGRSYKRTERIMMVATPLLSKRLRNLAAVSGITLSTLLYQMILSILEQWEEKAIDNLS